MSQQVVPDTSSTNKSREFTHLLRQHAHPSLPEIWRNVFIGYLEYQELMIRNHTSSQECLQLELLKQQLPPDESLINLFNISKMCLNFYNFEF